MQTEKKIIVATFNGDEIININEIKYITAKNKYVDIYLKGEKVLEAYVAFKNILEKLDLNYFFRCHKSFIVNLNYIESIDLEYKKIKIGKEKEVPLSRYRKKEFKKVLCEFCNMEKRSKEAFVEV